jgi:glucose/arabinose dehydrogenase
MRQLLLAITFLSLHPALVTSQPLISFNTVVNGLNSPVDVVEVNDSSHRLFIVEQPGQIRIWTGTSLSATPFLNIASIITSGGEQGLLSLAFHPNYISNGFFYIYYTNTSGAITVARYSRSTANTADPASGVVLLTIPKRFSNHNGGNLEFGPDGYLYFATGDGGSGGDPDNNAQNGASLLGKMLRIDVNNANPPYYSIPSTNPFAGSTTVKPEIIALGLRNPWRWSFDKQTGDMWIADVGQNEWEEVNIVAAANVLNKNYGWSCLEGTHTFKNCPAPANNVVPVFEYPHNNATGGYSITGGYVYRGAEFPALQGYYLFTDFSTANGWLTKENGSGGWTTTMQTKWADGISSFGETANGTLYATSLSGSLLKVIASTPLPIRLVAFSGAETANSFQIKWQIENEEKGDVYVVEKSASGSNFSEIERRSATNNRSSNSYSIKIPLAQQKVYYRLKIISRDGQVRFSNTISYNGNAAAIFKTAITGKNLTLTLPAGTTNLVILDAAGKMLLSKQTAPAVTQLIIPLSNSARGIITVKVLIDKIWQVKQVLY